MSTRVPEAIGEFKVLEEIGRGGMGTLYRARDPRIGRDVAIKLLREGIDDADMRERFAREARSAGRLKHGNIVTIFELGKHNEMPFIAMEYVQGETLASFLKRRPAVSLSRKIEIMNQVCAGLHYAHRMGIVHRDIKPANIMIDDEGTVKILDFGIARMGTSKITQTGMVIGTLNYMAPEQMKGMTTDARADIFSFGAVFYEVLSYRSAFAGDAPSTVMHRILYGQPEQLGVLCPTLNPELAATVMRCLEKQPENRFQDLGAIGTILNVQLQRVQRSVEADDTKAPPAPKQSSLVGDATTPADELTNVAKMKQRQDPEQKRTELIQLHIRNATRALEKGDPDTALEACEQALILDPTNNDALDLHQRMLRRASLTSRLDAQRMPDELEDALGVTAPVSARELNLLHAKIPSERSTATAAPAPDEVIIVREPERSGFAPDLPEVHLVVTQGDSRLIGRSVRVDKPRFIIGRSTDCDFSLADPSWSRTHAELVYANDEFILRDYESSNGVYVNGRKVREAALRFGATITIGRSQLTFTHVRDTTLPDLSGIEIAGRYHLLELLGDSTKGAVYSANDHRTGGKVALKLLSPALLRYRGYREDFQRSARIAVTLRHPHICSVIDFGNTQLQIGAAKTLQTDFICSVLMTGGNLAAKIDAKEAFSLQRVEQWLTAIASALEFAHTHDVLHGDLKPSAIVFDEGNHPYVTDFTVTERGQDRSPVIGTPAYMAPEVWADGAITAASDQFALAALIYYLLTGSRPFEGQEQPDVRRRNFLRGPIAACDEGAQNGRNVPRAASNVLSKALASNPVDRFESVASFAAAFTAALRRPVDSNERPQVFMSYQREGSALLANFLADKLRAQGIHVFVDTQGIDSAGRFTTQIERAIEDADVFMCLLAQTTLQSTYVIDEIRAAHRYDKPMIPVMQESYQPIPAGADPAITALLDFQGVEILDKKSRHLEHSVLDLVRLVRSAVTRREHH